MPQIDRLGVIDLGTNTFHLLIVDLKPDGFVEIYRERRFIKLAEGGINVITAPAFNRALDAMKTFRQILNQKKVGIVKAFGTAALRTASNGQNLVKMVLEETDINIELISGIREAELIYKGVAQAVPLNNEIDLIMDIGGGSVEFILANKDEIFWAESFPVGVAVLYDRFHKVDPIPVKAIRALEEFLEIILTNLWEKARKYIPNRLIGASGTFDVLENIFASDRENANYALINTKPFYPFAQELINSSLEQRLQTDGVPEKRADMIVVAALLIRVVLDKLNLEQIAISQYAMKEGMIFEMMS